MRGFALLKYRTLLYKQCTLIKKKIKFSSYIRIFRVEQLQSHIWLTASSYIGKYLPISSYIRKPFLIYDFETAPLRISLYMMKIWFSFLSVHALCAARSKINTSQNFYADKRSVVESEVANLCVCVWRLKMCNYGTACSTACASRECDP